MGKLAKFRFLGYHVTKSLIEIHDILDVSEELSVDFNIKGAESAEDSRFKLSMSIIVADAKKQLKIELAVEGLFEFDPDCDKGILQNFFKANAPAILFPYLRAHIATLSTLSGLNKPIMLPTLNLSNLDMESD